MRSGIGTADPLARNISLLRLVGVEENEIEVLAELDRHP